MGLADGINYYQRGSEDELGAVVNWTVETFASMQSFNTFIQQTFYDAANRDVPTSLLPSLGTPQR